jgi:hypothetical protein
MHLCIKKTLIIAACLIPSIAKASPVSFKGGYGVMANYSGDRFDSEINYSLSRNSALGISSIDILDHEKGTPRFKFAKFNYLLKRWNQVDSQTNIYLSSGIGTRRLNQQDSLSGLLSIESNFETRTFYTSLLAEALVSEDSKNNESHFNRLRYRLGFTPYKAPFNSLNTWLIGQLEFTPELQEKTTLTPTSRFFYKNFALEIGYNITNKNLYSGIMLHF